MELGAACIRAGESFMRDPHGVLTELAATGSYSNGNFFPTAPDVSEIQNLIWITQLKLLMPKIEMFRQSFLESHKDEIQQHLPCENAINETITDYHHVELGLLWSFYCKNYFNIIGSRDEQNLKLYREARNQLAHLKPLDYAMVKKLL